MNNESPLWIAWERHRRTRELCGVLDASLRELVFKGPYWLKVPILTARTLGVLLRERPKVLWVQNPSVVLASFAGLMKKLFGYTLVVDRHSNFKLDSISSSSLKFRVFHFLSRYSVRKADLTIVTNDYLRNLVDEWGGRGFALPDRFPDLDGSVTTDLGPGRHLLYICSFDSDEPVEVVMEAAKTLPSSITIHVTGNYAKLGEEKVHSAPPNVRFTGYLSDNHYLALLNSCDAVMTLTTNPHTMQCGAYEAVSVGKPLVIGPDRAMVDYFFKGNVVAQLNPEGLAGAINQVFDTQEKLQGETRELFKERSVYWEGLFDSLKRTLGVG